MVLEKLHPQRGPSAPRQYEGHAMERIADRLREARRNAGFPSAQAFAEHVKIAPDIYRSYEDGTRYMSPQLGYRLAQVLGVGWVDLLYGPEYTDEDADYGWQGTISRRRPATPNLKAALGAVR
jgi:ribosome-binding protein aMBF1 (putative translation factor)